MPDVTIMHLYAAGIVRVFLTFSNFIVEQPLTNWSLCPFLSCRLHQLQFMTPCSSLYINHSRPSLHLMLYRLRLVGTQAVSVEEEASSSILSSVRLDEPLENLKRSRLMATDRPRETQSAYKHALSLCMRDAGAHENTIWGRRPAPPCYMRCRLHAQQGSSTLLFECKSPLVATTAWCLVAKLKYKSHLATWHPLISDPVLHINIAHVCDAYFQVLELN